VPPFLAIARATRVTLLITLALDKGEALTVRTGAISCEHWSIAAVWSIRKAVLREICRLGSYVRLQQVTGPIRRTAALLAGHGFVVVVPEIFHELEEPGTVLPYDQAGADRGNADKINKELSSYDADAKAALSSLKSHPKCTGRIGSMGFCIGGHLAFRSATNPEVLAATCCYPTDIHKRSLGKGLNDDTLDRIPEIRGELLVVFGRQDPHIPREGRATIYNALADAGTNFSWHEFNGAHAFMRDEGARYDAAAARTVYAMALDLFRRKLSEGDLSQIQGSTETRH
jgi:carboxymethylenebutenolidase